MRKQEDNKRSQFLKLAAQAFAINKQVPLPWTKALSAGVCSALPVLIGVLMGQVQYGLIAGLGGLAFLYMFNEPYALRSKKIFFAVLGLSFSAGLGTLLSQSPVLAALAVGSIGAIAVFIFGAYQFKGPSAIFFVLVFLITNNMVEEPSLAVLHAALVFAGGFLSWGMAMWGWKLNPYAAEKAAVKKEYDELALWLESADSPNFYESRQKMWVTIKAAESTLESGYSIRTTVTERQRLVSLHQQVKLIYSDAIERVANGSAIPAQALENIRLIALSMGAAGNNRAPASGSEEHGPDDVLSQHIQKAYSILNATAVTQNASEELVADPFTTVFFNSFNKNSMVFFAALRFGVVVTIAALIANFLNVEPSYWIPLSCAAVMSGATVISTFNRALQRSTGTIVGIVIAAILLSFQPESLFIVLAIFTLTALTELAIVLNYAVAAFFITPNALMIAESTSQIGDISYFASARVIDVLIGSAIGLIGTLLIGRRRASSLLPRMTAKALRSQQRFIGMLFSPHTPSNSGFDTIEQQKMKTNLIDLKLVFETARGELSSNKGEAASLLPVFFALEQLGFLLENAAQINRQTLSPLGLGQLYLVFEMMANAVEDKWLFSKQPVPEIPGFPDIERELTELQEAVNILKRPGPANNFKRF